MIKSLLLLHEGNYQRIQHSTNDCHPVRPHIPSAPNPKSTIAVFRLNTFPIPNESPRVQYPLRSACEAPQMSEPVSGSLSSTPLPRPSYPFKPRQSINGAKLSSDPVQSNPIQSIFSTPQELFMRSRLFRVDIQALGGLDRRDFGWGAGGVLERGCRGER